MGAAATARAALDGGSAAALVVRPERLRIVGPDDAGAAATGANTVEAFVGRPQSRLDPRVRADPADGQAATVCQQVGGDETVWQSGDRVHLTWAIDDGVLVSDPAG